MSFGGSTSSAALTTVGLESHAAPLALDLGEDKENFDWDNCGNGGTFRVRCRECRTWVATGSRYRSLQQLRAHVGSKSCLRQRANQKGIVSEARQARQVMFPVSISRLGRAGGEAPASAVNSVGDELMKLSTPSEFADHERGSKTGS